MNAAASTFAGCARGVVEEIEANDQWTSTSSQASKDDWQPSTLEMSSEHEVRDGQQARKRCVQELQPVRVVGLPPRTQYAS
jgi:hypothetical protein